MPYSNVNNITGSDGVVPIYSPQDRWTTWNITEIYLGTVGAGKFVPKVRDYVVDTDTNQYWRVTSIDQSTLIAVLAPVVSVSAGAFSETDVLLGVGPGTQSDTYRVYIDNSVIPSVMAVDARLHVAGTMVTTCKIFRGSELSGSEFVISAFYDQSGNLLGQAIPLELVAMPNGQNYSIKTVPVCYTVATVPDGEIVTAVFYSDSGHVVSKRQLLVENTAFIRSSNTAVKYITSITLETPFLSSSDPRLVQYPMNIPLNGLSLIGVVHYSNGETLKMPVDGTKFSIFGFDGYVATIVGQQLPLVLRYTLSANEIVYASSVVGNDRFITAAYNATTLKVNGAYTVKLFGYPVWVSDILGYTMEWYLYNLERGVTYHVTPYVRFNTNARVFDPTAYGVTQHLSVSLNLKDVNGSFTAYNHVQTIDIALLAPGTARTTNWTVGFDPNQNPQYGVGLSAASTYISQNLCTVKLDCGLSTLNDWLAQLYYQTKPLTDVNVETKPPVPNFFALIVNGQSIEFPLVQWNSVITLNTALINSGTLFIKFFKRGATTDLQLAISALPIYQQN